MLPKKVSTFILSLLMSCLSPTYSYEDDGKKNSFPTEDDFYDYALGILGLPPLSISTQPTNKSQLDSTNSPLPRGSQKDLLPPDEPIARFLSQSAPWQPYPSVQDQTSFTIRQEPSHPEWYSRLEAFPPFPQVPPLLHKDESLNYQYLFDLLEELPVDLLPELPLMPDPIQTTALPPYTTQPSYTQGYHLPTYTGPGYPILAPTPIQTTVQTTIQTTFYPTTTSIPGSLYPSNQFSSLPSITDPFPSLTDFFFGAQPTAAPSTPYYTSYTPDYFRPLPAIAFPFSNNITNGQDFPVGIAWQPRQGKRKIGISKNDFNFLEIVKDRKKRARPTETTEPVIVTAEDIENTQENLRKKFLERISFTLTTDQAETITQIEADLESTESIDRAVIAPVGAGKTEIAMHAAFKAISMGKQVAILTPRCALSEQHYHKFSERFKDIAKVVFISTAYPKKKKYSLYTMIQDGTYQIIIGTHCLLTDQISYKGLGLVIIDEEQGFGVKQKEFLCKKYPNAHTLILTATPIPRTQELIKLGYYKSSEINTLPEDRLPIDVHLKPFNPTRSEFIDSIVNTIKREKERNGLTFFVTHKISSLELLEEFMNNNLPEISYKILHGKIKIEDREDILGAFRQRKFDVLLTTNIIGVGIDIPIANTILIHDAHKFGLSDLYQLKGRVGRSASQGYAILLYDGDNIRPSSLQKLKAVEKFTDLNDSKALAEIDLQIRGGGDVLSTNQHGHGRANSKKILEQYLKEQND